MNWLRAAARTAHPRIVHPPSHPRITWTLRSSSLLASPSPQQPRTLPPSFFLNNFHSPSPSLSSSPALNLSSSSLFSSSDASTASAPLPILPPPSVGRWLLISSALVFAVIVVGGVTRLTESGLSITEWKPITGTIPPLTEDEWEVEFAKYKDTPEFKLLNHSISLTHFKRIFYMEWLHRNLGRLIGVSFVLPLTYFAFRRQLPRALSLRLTGLAALIGVQGLLGWYMVQSGLSEEIMDTPGAVPRVSQYRLAAHLGAALVLYVGMLGTGLGALRDWKWARGGAWSGLNGEDVWERALGSRGVGRFKSAAWGMLGLVFLTALSGAFVAGLDAGLVYNEFPLMGGRIVPPPDELFSKAYAKREDKKDWWRNFFENPTTVQFDHRVMATTTYFSLLTLYLSSISSPISRLLPPLTKRLTTLAFLTANIQVLLGISTLIYLVPTELAAAHQAGSVALLSVVMGLVASLRVPGKGARAWRAAMKAAKGSMSSSKGTGGN